MSLDFSPALDKIESLIAATGLFEIVNLHEPKNAPGDGLNVAVFLNAIGPVPNESGQASTTGRVVFIARVFGPMLEEPADMIDKNLGHAASAIMEALSGDFELGSNVKYVDLLGASGTPLSALGGYMEISKKMFRIMDVTIPIIINDIWAQEGS
jgi:hypothetical protein